MNNYIIKINGNAFVVLNCENISDAMLKLDDHTKNLDDVDIHVSRVDGDVIPLGDEDVQKKLKETSEDSVGRMNPSQPMTVTQSFSEKSNPDSQVTPPMKWDTSEIQPKPLVQRPLWMEQSLSFQPPEPQIFTTPPKSELVGYSISHYDKIRMEFIQCLARSSATIPPVPDDIKSWWYDIVITSMTAIHGYKLMDLSNLQIRSTTGMLELMFGETLHTVDRELRMLQTITITPTDIKFNYFADNNEFLKICISINERYFEVFMNDKVLQQVGLDDRYIGHIASELNLKSMFRHNKTK
jgi:hypothetical protein